MYCEALASVWNSTHGLKRSTIIVPKPLMMFGIIVVSLKWKIIRQWLIKSDAWLAEFAVPAHNARSVMRDPSGPRLTEAATIKRLNVERKSGFVYKL